MVLSFLKFATIACIFFVIYKKNKVSSTTEIPFDYFPISMTGKFQRKLDDWFIQLLLWVSMNEETKTTCIGF